LRREYLGTSLGTNKKVAKKKSFSIDYYYWWRRWDSNPRPLDCQL